MGLRDYQQRLIDDFFTALDDGFTAPCIVLPCGGGKSVILAEIAKIYTAKDKRVLFIVHRKELCEQISATFTNYGVQMQNCKIAMVQTLTRRLATEPTPDLIITDENHHSLATSYKRIYEHFNTVPRIGVTATPERINGAGLADVNDKLIVGVNAKWLIANGYLTPYDYYAPIVDLPKFHTRNGDFVQSEVTDFFNKNQRKIYGDVVRHYRRLADGKQAICYLPTVDFSKQTAQKFNEQGIASAHIDGGTPKGVRDEIINRFRRGEIKILCNVDIVSEGFDVPDCECVILLRPTKSLILYTQQAMRCMRYKPNKRAIIIDHVNNIQRFGFPDKEREWLLDGHPKQKKDGEAPLKSCPMCFRALPISATECPCGYEFETNSGETTTVNTELVNLVDPNSTKERVKFFKSANECQTVEELTEFAKFHKYKPGWVYYQQIKRGWLNGDKRRNKNTKRYPCRPVGGWNS